MARRLVVWSMKDLVECINKMTSKEVKYDCVIFISGKRGSGKSTVGYKIASTLEIEQPFKPKRDLVYSREDTLKHLANKINGVILSDEMVNVAYKRDFYQEDQKELLKAFDMYRDSRNVFIGCIPIFSDLDVKIQKVCKIWIDVVSRGKALIHTQVKSSYLNDPWDLKNNMKVESKWTMRGISKPRYGQLSTIRGVLFSGDLSVSQREEYDAIKAEKRAQVFSKYSNEDILTDPEQIFTRNLMNQLKSYKLTPATFELLCSVNGNDSNKIRRKVNEILKQENNNLTYKDFCMDEKKKLKRERLGFKVPLVEDKPLNKPTSVPLPIERSSVDEVNNEAYAMDDASDEDALLNI